MPATVNTPATEARDTINRKLGRKPGRVHRYDQRTQLNAEIVCANGFTFGLRVGEKHGSIPRAGEGPWTHVEVVAPNRTLGALARYRRDTNTTRNGDIYTEVPVELLDRLVARNGGLR